MADITLTCPTINSGNPVSLRGASVNYTWKNLNKAVAIPGQFSSVVEVEQNGNENPAIVIGGYINVNNTPANTITEPLLKQFAQNQYDGTVNTAITLIVPAGDTPTYMTNYDGTVNSVRIVIDSISITYSSAGSDNAHFWNYNLKCTETL